MRRGTTSPGNRSGSITPTRASGSGYSSVVMEARGHIRGGSAGKAKAEWEDDQLMKQAQMLKAKEERNKGDDRLQDWWD